MDDYDLDMAVNLTSAILAAKKAVAGFKQLLDSAARTFIYSGNKLNVRSDPKSSPFGIAKTGAPHMIWDCSNAYRSQGYKRVRLLNDLSE